MGRDSMRRHTASFRRTQGQMILALVVVITLLAGAVLVALRSEAFALSLITRALGERSTPFFTSPSRCCDTRFASAQLGFTPLRIDVRDFELLRHDPMGALGGERVLATTPLLSVGLDFGALLDDRPALTSISLGPGEGAGRIEASSVGAGKRWTIDVQNLSLALFRLYFASAEELAGSATGTVALTGSLFTPQVLDVDLVVDDASIHIQRFDIEGRVVIEGDLVRDALGLGGRFVIDVGDAEVNVANAYKKPRGVAGAISGKLAPGEDGRIHASEYSYQAKKAKVEIRL